MNSPRLLVLDIENSYLLAGTWGLWNQNINLDLLLDCGKVLSVAAKWIGEKSIIFHKCDDKGFHKSIWKLLDEADAVITYNGRKHDIPLLNRELLKEGLGPYSPIKHIDLLETMKKQFKFPSNKLAHITEELGLGKKLDHGGFQLWVNCLKGDEDAWKKMEKYNKQDVRLTEKLFHKVRAWCNLVVNYALYSSNGDVLCPHCGSDHLHKRGYYRTTSAIYQKFNCQVCKGWSRTRYTEVTKEERKNILVKAN